MSFLKVFLVFLISSQIFAANEFKDVVISDVREVALISEHLAQAEAFDDTMGCSYKEIYFEVLLDESDLMIGSIDLIKNGREIPLDPKENLFFFIEESIGKYDPVFPITPELDKIKSMSAIQKICTNGEESLYYLRFPIQ